MLNEMPRDYQKVNILGDADGEEKGGISNVSQQVI